MRKLLAVPVRSHLWGIVIAAVLFLPATAAARPPVCAPDASADASWARLAFTELGLAESPRVPAEVIAGRSTPVQVYVGMADELSDPNDWPTVDLVSASAESLRHPFTGRYNQELRAADWEAFPEVPVLLEDGEAAQIVVSGADTTYGAVTGQCWRSARSRVITATPALLPRPRKPHRFWVDGGYRTEGVELTFATGRCAGAFVVRLRLAGRTTKLVSQDCEADASAVGKGGVRIRWNAAQGRLRMWVQKRARFSRTVRYTASMDGEVAKSGSFHVRSRYYPGTKATKIYSDTDFDDYVNTCINESKNVYAENGRLYCAVGETRPQWSWGVSRLR